MNHSNFLKLKKALPFLSNQELEDKGNQYNQDTVSSKYEHTTFKHFDNKEAIAQITSGFSPVAKEMQGSIYVFPPEQQN